MCGHVRSGFIPGVFHKDGVLQDSLVAHALVKKKSKNRVGLSPHTGQLPSAEPGLTTGIGERLPSRLS